MTKFICDTELDKLEFLKSLDYCLTLMYGNNFEEYQKAYDLFMQKVSKVTILKANENGNYANFRSPGAAALEGEFIEIELLGFTNMKYYSYYYTKHVFLHEINHALVKILTEKYQQKKFYKTGNIIHFNSFGEIKEYNLNTGEEITYGDALNEAFVNILATMAGIQSDKECRNVSCTIDDALKKNISNFKDSITENSIFESIVKLLIWAFSNNGKVKYQQQSGILENGYNKSNSFIYGMLADQVYIEKEYDFYMGTGSYKELCLIIDEEFNKYNDKLALSKELPKKIKYITSKLTEFVIKKNEYCVNNNIYSQKEANIIIKNYCTYLMSFEFECDMFFTSYLSKIIKKLQKK